MYIPRPAQSKQTSTILARKTADKHRQICSPQQGAPTVVRRSADRLCTSVSCRGHVRRTQLAWRRNQRHFAFACTAKCTVSCQICPANSLLSRTSNSCAMKLAWAESHAAVEQHFLPSYETWCTRTADAAPELLVAQCCNVGLCYTC